MEAQSRNHKVSQRHQGFKGKNNYSTEVVFIEFQTIISIF